MNIFVANISQQASSDSLKALFNHFGSVATVSIIQNKLTGQSKGFGFVDMPNEKEALAAIEGLANKSFEGKNLVVSKARPKTTVY